MYNWTRCLKRFQYCTLFVHLANITMFAIFICFRCGLIHNSIWSKIYIKIYVPVCVRLIWCMHILLCSFITLYYSATYLKSFFFGFSYFKFCVVFSLNFFCFYWNWIFLITNSVYSNLLTILIFKESYCESVADLVISPWYSSAKS